jgi:hypothetical protein
MSDFTDPLNDPRFPDRPNTPDFWQLSEIMTQIDGEMAEGTTSMGDFIAQFGDEPTITYMVQQKALNAAEVFGLVPDPQVLSILSAMMLNGFAVGYRFHERYRS